MNAESDRQLLRAYAVRRDEAAFRELVSRHTDLVYSAALRQVESDAAARDLIQGVFTDLARRGPDILDKHTGESLVGWLHRATRYAALNHLRDSRRRRDNERQAMQQLLTDSEPSADWRKIAPALDEALDSLGDDDREIILLRYFKNQDFRAVGQQLGVSDDTAQKRVSRAVEKLREFFSKRKITIGAGGLVVLISANAVQSAPVALAATISATALAGTAVTTSTLIAATKTIAMITLQKTIIVGTIAALAGAGIYQARQAAQLRNQVQTLQQQQAPLVEQMRQLQDNFSDATNRLANLLAENSRLKSNPREAELLKLRGQVGVLQANAGKEPNSDSKKSMAEVMKSPQMREMMKASAAASLDKVYAGLFADLKLAPEQVSRLKELITDKLIAGTTEKAAMLSGKISLDQIHQLNSQINADKAGADGQIQQMLGADGYAAFQSYEKTYTERSEIVGPMGFSDQLTGSAELTADQTEQLVQAMANERQQFKFTVDYSDPGTFAGDRATLFSDENISQYQKEMEQLNQLYLARAQTILTPDQQIAFQKFLSSRLAIQNMGLNMSAKMLGATSGKN